MEVRIIHIDIETTGMYANTHCMHRIAGMAEIDGDVVSSFDITLRPTVPCAVDPKALEVGGVTWNEVRSYEPADIAFNRFLSAMRVVISETDPSTRFYLCAYNAGAMEVPFLREMYKRFGRDFNGHFYSGFIDTMALATNYCIQNNLAVVDYTLSGMCRVLGIPVEEKQLHLPSYDAKLSRLIYHKVK